MKLLIHNNELSGRGDSTLSLTTSKMLKSFCGINSVISSPKHSINELARVKAIEDSGIEVFLYSQFDELVRFTRKSNITDVLWVHEGKYSPQWIPETRQLVYAVFNHFEPYGDRYAYISEWLYKKAIETKRTRDSHELDRLRSQTNSPYGVDKEMQVGFVPLAVDAMNGDGLGFRKKIGVPKDSFLIGRIGGYFEFDDHAAHNAVIELLGKTDYFFVFVNTLPFVLHPRVKYLNFIANEQEKWDFYDACNLFINGRLMGESFGFSIVEPLAVGKPILAPGFARNKDMDAHHIQVLNPLGFIYSSADDLKRLVHRIRVEPPNSDFLKNAVAKFSPKVVSAQFKNYFLH